MRDRTFADRFAVRQQDIGERLMRGLEMKGDLPQLMRNEFDASITAEDLTTGEYDYLRRRFCFTAGEQQAAVALQFASVRLQCPTANLPMLAVIDEVVLNNTSASVLLVFVGLVYNFALPTANGNQKPRDSRMQSARAAFVVNASSEGAAALTGTAAEYVQVPANSMMRVPGPWYLTGLTSFAGANPALLCQVGVANTPLTAHFRWRERLLLDSER